jgi:hypothetical protein
MTGPLVGHERSWGAPLLIAMTALGSLVGAGVATATALVQGRSQVCPTGAVCRVAAGTSRCVETISECRAGHAWPSMSSLLLGVVLGAALGLVSLDLVRRLRPSSLASRAAGRTGR